MHAFDKILVATDFSEHSAEAARIAIDLAQRYGATLRFIHVFQPITYILPDAYAVYSPTQLTEIIAELDKRLAAHKRDADAAGVSKVETDLIQGVPATEIVRDAAANGCGLIVLGTHGRTGLKHAVIGSIAEKVVRTAGCPVLTVKCAKAS